MNRAEYGKIVYLIEVKQKVFLPKRICPPGFADPI